MTPSPSDDLVLPPGARPPRTIPKCPACQEEFTEGQLIVHFIGAVAPGALKTAPIHLGCAVATVQAQAEEASEVAQEVEAEIEEGVEEAKAWVHGDVGEAEEPGG